MKIDINADASVVFANKLEKIHRAALPNAVRSTLNSVAFDVKKKTMPSQAKKIFEERRANFFKGTSKVEMARGWNINEMSSVVGFVGAEKNQAVEDLEKQERGGSIDGRSFVPLPAARIGENDSNAVHAKYRTKNFKNIVRAGKQRGGSTGVRFIKAAIKAGKGGNVIGQNGLLYRVLKINSRSHTFKLRAIYTFKKGRSVKIKPTGFMKKASQISHPKMNRMFEIEAKKQIKKFMK